MTVLDRLVERRSRARAARQFARWRATNLIDQNIDRSDGRRINSAGQRLLTASINVRDNVIVCDGVYVSGGIARLDSFLSLAQEHDAVVYVDDAHGIGVLGSRRGGLPLGHGGAGSTAFCGVRAGNHVHVSGLSKAFGVPVAFVAGPERFIEHLRLTAGNFVHSSPPATPILAAALAALQIHEREGDDLRCHLVSLVRRFRNGLCRVGLEPKPAWLFPIQSLHLPSGTMATIAASTLRHQGIWPVLQLAPPEQPGGGAIRFVLSAVHQAADIDGAAATIART